MKGKISFFSFCEQKQNLDDNGLFNSVLVFVGNCASFKSAHCALDVHLKR